MDTQQIAACGILAFAMVMFVWNRLRYDLVAALALIAGVAVGVVPADKAFGGFSDQIVIIVASALVLSAAVNRSGIIERLMRPLMPSLKRTGSQVVVLGGTVAVLSAFIKNIGALAAFLPVAIQVSRQAGTPKSRLLMPLAFASLLGGLATLIGTSPNIIVSRMRAELGGEPFTMFDFLPVGGTLAVAGLLFLAVGWRLLPAGGAGKRDQAFELADYMTELTVPEDSPVVGKTVAELEKLGQDQVTVSALVRLDRHRYVVDAHWPIHAGDILQIQGEHEALERLADTAKLTLVAQKDDEEKEKKDKKDKKEKKSTDADKPKSRSDRAIMEAVVAEGSALIDRTLSRLRLRDRMGINLLAISRRGEQIQERLRGVKFRAGDVVVLEGDAETLPDALASMKLLPLAERKLMLGRERQALVPVGLLVVAMALAAFQIVPTTMAFFGAAVGVVAFGALSLKDAYEAIEWPILVLLACLIPVSDALRTTGVTDLLAGWLSVAAAALPPIGALMLILVVAMLVTPFLNNAATVLVMAPIAASFAKNLGLNADPFLMAVAVGAASDFLTPIGHQCNTLVMGPGGYKFSDYPRLGLPLSILVATLGTVLIAFFWPLKGG
jgi:di/tricarboxylate transporter